MKPPVHHFKKLIKYGDGRKSHWSFADKLGWLDSKVKDKKGTPIYEGDIVKDYKDEIFTVVFDGCAFDLENDDKAISLDMYNGCVEVVGHIAEENGND